MVKIENINLIYVEVTQFDCQLFDHQFKISKIKNKKHQNQYFEEH
jgi:hypothetical protein